MKTLFLAKVEYQISHYMGRTENEQAFHIVQAEDSGQAYKAVESHYEKQTDEYNVYYSVNSIEITEMIVADTLSVTEESA